MISGTHIIIYSSQPEKDRDFFINVLKCPSVDVGDGWLIMGLPASELAVHPSKENNIHEFYLMCDDVEQFIDAVHKHRIRCSKVKDMGWGLLTQLSLPGGGKLGVYQPRHARPAPMKVIKSLKKRPVRQTGH